MYSSPFPFINLLGHESFLIHIFSGPFPLSTGGWEIHLEMELSNGGFNRKITELNTGKSSENGGGSPGK